MVVILSALQAIDFVCSNASGKLTTNGVDSFFLPKENFSSLKSQLVNNAYLATNQPLLDERLNNILAILPHGKETILFLDGLQSYLKKINTKK